MFRWLRRKRKGSKQQQKPPTLSELQEQSKGQQLSPDLERSIKSVCDLFGGTDDLIVRRFRVGEGGAIEAAILQIDGMIDPLLSADEILATLMQGDKVTTSPRLRSKLDTISESLLAITQVEKSANLDKIGYSLASGYTVLLVAGERQALLCSTQGFQHRPVEEPASESGVRVPREGFTEVLAINRSLVRRRVRDPRLCFKQMKIGSVSQTEVAIAYIRGLADEALVDEVKQRLERITLDAILESGYIEELISDNPNTIFPLTRRTERPDTIAAALLEGRVAIFTDGTPFVLSVPVTLPELLHASEDYYTHWAIGSFVRILRYGAYLFAMYGPAVYVAFITYHHEMLPIGLLNDIAASRVGVPFPAALEALFMLGVFEIMREAGIRLPRIVGSAMTIVGALVLGQQTVNAGLASPSMVVVVSGTAIASFANPSYALDTSSRILRIVNVIAAALIGLFGVFFVACLTAIHLCALRSFGVPYFAPFAPLSPGQVGKVLVRPGWWRSLRRPSYLHVREQQRQQPNARPHPPKGKDDA